MYGVDVGSRRADDLDKKLLTYVTEATGIRVLDVGAGKLGHAQRLAEAGAQVTAVDVTAVEHVPAKIRFIQGDIRNCAELLHDKQFEVCLFQRTLHYLRHEEACAVLRYLKTVIRDHLYISVTGVESDIGDQYADTYKPVHERFCTLPSEAAGVFSIYQPICLYTPEEFVVLLQEAGWEIEELWISAFGNIKAVCIGV